MLSTCKEAVARVSSSLKATSDRTRGKVMSGEVQGGYYSKSSEALEETAQGSGEVTVPQRCPQEQ